MKRILGACLAIAFLLLFCASATWAADESTLQQLRNDTTDAKNNADVAKNKANTNEGKITGFYDNINNLQQQIDNIQLIPGPQ